MASDSDVNPLWLQFQENTLREHAFAERDFFGLLVFHATLRNRAAMEALTPVLVGASPDIRLAQRLLLGEVPPDTLEVLCASTNPWLHYTAAKAFLRERRGKETIALAMNAPESPAAGLWALNLIARFFKAHGEADAARDLAEISLQLHPEQTDMLALRDNTGAETPRAFYLDTQPCPAPVTFYIPAYNVETYIRGAIEGLARQTCPIAEVLVVDDCGSDVTIDLARNYPVRIISHQENRGLAAARNTAFREAIGEWVGAIDTDAHPDPNYLQCAWMELENAAPNVAGVGGRLIEAHQDTPADLFRALHLGQDLGLHRNTDPGFLFGSNTLYRRTVVLDVGGYGEEFRTNAEDHDIGRKLRDAGHSFVFSPLLVARHQRRDTPASVLRTLWGWSYHEKRRRGLLDSWEHIAAMGRANIDEAVKLINADLAAGHPQAVYVDFLFLFHDTFHNLRHGEERGLLSTPVRASLQHALLRSLRDLDARWGANLHGKVWADTQALMPVNEPPEPLPQPFADWLVVMLEDLAGLYEALSRDLYRILAD